LPGGFGKSALWRIFHEADFEVMLKFGVTIEMCFSDSMSKLFDILEKNASRSGGVQRNRSMRQTHVFHIDLKTKYNNEPFI